MNHSIPVIAVTLVLVLVGALFFHLVPISTNAIQSPASVSPTLFLPPKSLSASFPTSLEFQSAGATTIPLTVNNYSSISRSGDMTRVLFPFAQNTLTGTQTDVLTKVQVLDETQTPIPAYPTIVSRWDGLASDTSKSIKFIQLDFPSTVSANANQTYYVRYNNAGGLTQISPTSPISVSSQTIAGVDTFIVNAGTTTFHIDKKQFRMFDQVVVNGTAVVPGDTTDGYYLDVDAAAEVAERGVAVGRTNFTVNHAESLAAGDSITFENVDFTAAAASIGANSITINNPTADVGGSTAALYSTGMQVRIGKGSNQETRSIQSVSGSRLTFTTALAFAHQASEPVTVINFPIYTISSIAGNVITISPATQSPMSFGYGIRKINGVPKTFSTAAANATVSLAEIEEQNPLVTTIHLVSNLAEVGGVKTLADVEVEARYHIYYNGLVDVDVSLVNRGSRGISYLQLSNNNWPAPQDLLIDQGYIKSSISLSSTKTIDFGALPNLSTSSDTFSASTTYTLTQQIYPGEVDPYNRDAYTPLDPSNNRLEDNLWGTITKKIGNTAPSTFYQNLGQGASNYICASGCTYSTQNNIPLQNQPGLRFENGIGVGDGTKGVSILPDAYFWEQAPSGFQTDGQSLKLIPFPSGVAFGIKRVGQYNTGPYGAEDFLYSKYRLFGAERNTVRASFKFFAQGETLASQMNVVKARKYKLWPRNVDYMQGTQAFFGIEPYYTNNQLATISWGPLQAAVNRFIKAVKVISDWQVSDPNSVNPDPQQGLQRSKFDYNFRTGKGYSAVIPYGKQRAGGLERGDSSDGLAYSNLYEWMKVLMMSMLKDDAPKPELYRWINYLGDLQLNNHGTLQFAAGKDPAYYNGQTLYERGDQYLQPDGAHFWDEGQNIYAFWSGDLLSKSVTQRWFDSYASPNGVPLNPGLPVTNSDCAYGRARENGWPASDLTTRYQFTGDPALLSAAEALVNYNYTCTQSPFNVNLALNFDPDTQTPLHGIDKMWMDNTDMRAAARLLASKQRAGTLGNDTRDAALTTYINQALAFMSGTTPNFSSVYGWGLPYSFDPSVGVTEIGTETNPTHYTKAAACSAYPSIGVFNNPAQQQWPGPQPGQGIMITNGCVNLYQWAGSDPLNVGDYQGARIVSNGYHSSTLAHMYYALESIPGQSPSALAPTIMKRLIRDGLLYVYTSTDAACGAGNTTATPATGPAGGQVNLNDPSCYSPVRGRDDQFAGAMFKSLPEALTYDEGLWVVNNVLDCTGLGGQICAPTQQCAGTLTTAVGTAGQATCCVQPASGPPVPQLCVNDTTAPTISNLAPTYGMLFGLTQVTLSISTNENATCYYTQNLSYAFPSTGTPSIPAFTTTGAQQHSTLITNLPQPGSVTYRIFCRDPAGNVGAANHTLSVLAPGLSPFTITAITATPTSNSAVVSWQTSVPTTGQVQYGPNTGLEFTASDATLGTNHSVSLSSLTPSTTYHYHILSVDPYTNTVSTSFMTFTTLPQAVSLTLTNPHYTQGNAQESSMQSNANNYDKQYPGLIVGYDNTSFPGKNRALLRFDLTSVPSTLDLSTFTATLQIKVKSALGSTASTMEIHRITSSQVPGFGDSSSALAVGESTWRRLASPNGLWTNCPSSTSGAAASAQCGAEGDSSTTDFVTATVPTAVDSIVSVDVTSIVHKWLDGTAQNDGFVLRTQNEASTSTTSYRTFYSNNDAFTSPNNNVPHLLIVGTTASTGGGSGSGGGTGGTCTNGQTQSCGVGVCASALQTCNNGVWSACSFAGITTYQVPETSCTDGLDNDCDGVPDCADSDCSTQAVCQSLVCGNGTCDAGESCISCAADCGVCPPTTSPGSPGNNSSGGSPSGGAGDSGSSSSSSSGGPSIPRGGNGNVTVSSDNSSTTTNGTSSSGSTIRETNPITDAFAGMGHAVVGAVSEDAAASYSTSLIAGVIIFFLGMGIIIHFLGFL